MRQLHRYCKTAAAHSTELGFKGQIYVEREERRKVKELETKMKKEWRNVKKKGTEQSNRERKQRPKRGNVGDANGRKELFVQFAA